jgi:hypothetical protein
MGEWSLIEAVGSGEERRMRPKETRQEKVRAISDLPRLRERRYDWKGRIARKAGAYGFWHDCERATWCATYRVR